MAVTILYYKYHYDFGSLPGKKQHRRTAWWLVKLVTGSCSESYKVPNFPRVWIAFGGLTTATLEKHKSWTQPAHPLVIWKLSLDILSLNREKPLIIYYEILYCHAKFHETATQHLLKSALMSEVKLVLQAVCIMKSIKPNRVKEGWQWLTLEGFPEWKTGCLMLFDVMWLWSLRTDFFFPPTSRRPTSFGLIAQV